MATARILNVDAERSMCAMCGIPVDSLYFDESGTADAPAPGRETVLARFELPPQYCGVLQYFSQFTDLYGKDCSKIETPGIEWLILSNRRPLYPYLRLERIVNPWGYGSFPINIRLDEGTVLEAVVRGTSKGTVPDEDQVKRVGARLVGRFWYNVAYGDVLRRS